MLIGIDVVLNADILYILRAMGHGDDIAVVDATFPVESHARRYVRTEGCDLNRMLKAILKLLPIDRTEPGAAIGMQVIGQPDHRMPVHQDIKQMVEEATGGALSLDLCERFAFYERARKCFAIIATGELRDYGNVILRKGDAVTS
jgi:L-fucose mutarotase